MKILVTGTEGYIGSLLAPILMQSGHEVIRIDTGFYKVGLLYNDTALTAKTLNKDIRHITEDLQGVEAVVHLAESNTPAGQLCPDVTYEINYKGSVHLANLGSSASVRRVNTSSCSVYGVDTDNYVENSSVDNRSYRVSFEKINTILPGFKCEWNAIKGAGQLFDLFAAINMSSTFLFRGFTRLKQLEYLIRT